MLSRLITLLLVSSLSLISTYHAFSQQGAIVFQHLDAESGLSHSDVNCITQDKKGFIWIGTKKGLDRYDGHFVKSFKNLLIKPNDYQDDEITCSFEDHSGKLWFGTTGLLWYDPQHKKHQIYRKGDGCALPSNDIISIVEDENHKLWVATRRGLCGFHEGNQNFITFLHDTTGNTQEVYLSNRITAIIPDGKGKLWISCLSGLYSFALSSRQFSSNLLENCNSHIPPKSRISTMCMDCNGNLILAIPAMGIFQFDTAAKSLRNLDPPKKMAAASKDIEHVICSHNGDIHFASKYSGYLVNFSNTNRWAQYSHDPFDKRSLIQNGLKSLYEDKAGMIWISTQGKGVDRYCTNGEKFKTSFKQYGKPGGMCYDDITDAFEDDNETLWLGSKSGLMKYDSKDETFICYTESTQGSPNLNNHYIHALTGDHKKIIWAGTEAGLAQFDVINNNFKYFENVPSILSSISGSVIYDVLIDSQGRLVAGTSSGINRMIGNQKFENLWNNLNIQNLLHEFYTTLFQDSHSDYWLSTSRSGIFHTDKEFKAINYYKNNQEFKATKAHHFSEDSLTNIWMATNCGVWIWSRRNNSIFQLKSSDQLLNEEINSMVLVSNKEVWLGTHKGLLQCFYNLNYIVDSIKHYDHRDGLQGNVFYPGSALRLKNGTLFFGGSNGFSVYDPKNAPLNTYVPPVEVSCFKISGEEFSLDEFDNGYLKVELEYFQNDIEIELSALSYNHPEKNTFYYQLNGYDKELKSNGNNPVLSYVKLPPGDYNLNFLAKNNDGIGSYSVKQLRIIIHAAFWQTNWFYLLLISIFIGFTILLYNLRVKNLKRRQILQTETIRMIADAKMSALRAQMNPHFIFNSINSIQQLISVGNKEQALKYLSRFSRMVRLVLESTRYDTISISDELKLINLYLDMETLRFPGKFNYSCKIDSNIDIEKIKIPSMMIQPIVENAVIHGLLNKKGSGEILLEIIKESNIIVCMVTDNGIGRLAATNIKNSRQQKFDSMGLQVIKERIDMLQWYSFRKTKLIIKDLVNNDGSAAGTSVRLEIVIET